MEPLSYRLLLWILFCFFSVFMKPLGELPNSVFIIVKENPCKYNPLPPSSTASEQAGLLIKCPPSLCDDENRPFVQVTPYFHHHHHQILLLLPLSPPLTSSPSLPNTTHLGSYILSLILLRIFGDYVRSFFVMLSSLRESYRLCFLVLFTLFFHGYFTLHGEISSTFVSFVGVSCFILSILKLSLTHDHLHITEDIGLSFFKIGMECLILHKQRAIWRACLCLLPFGVSLFSKFSPPVAAACYRSLLAPVVEMRRELWNELGKMVATLYARIVEVFAAAFEKTEEENLIE